MCLTSLRYFSTLPLFENVPVLKSVDRTNKYLSSNYYRARVLGAICDHYQIDKLKLRKVSKNKYYPSRWIKVKWLFNKVNNQISYANRAFNGSGIQFKLIKIKFKSQNTPLLDSKGKVSENFETLIKKLALEDQKANWKINIFIIMFYLLVPLE